MASKSRRKAREGALRALYSMEIGDIRAHEAIEAETEEIGLSSDLAAYLTRLVQGVKETRQILDANISKYLRDYDIARLAVIDRNLLRLATYELFYVPEMPPAVTINEVIEIGKRYSTAESGRFINGVLGRVVLDSPKANWDPKTAPPELFEDPAPEDDEPETEEIEVTPEDASFKAAKRAAGWKLRSDE